MLLETKVIDQKVHYRTSPDGEWDPVPETVNLQILRNSGVLTQEAFESIYVGLMAVSISITDRGIAVTQGVSKDSNISEMLTAMAVLNGIDPAKAIAEL